VLGRIRIENSILVAKAGISQNKKPPNRSQWAKKVTPPTFGRVKVYIIMGYVVKSEGANKELDQVRHA
jgi:hypothetical protein